MASVLTERVHAEEMKSVCRLEFGGGNYPLCKKMSKQTDDTTTKISVSSVEQPQPSINRLGDVYKLQLRFGLRQFIKRNCDEGDSINSVNTA